MTSVHTTTRPGVANTLTFVVGDRFLVALPVSAHPRVIDAIARRIPDSPTIEDLVALIPLGGDDAVETFAVVRPSPAPDRDGVPVAIVVRGEVAIDVYSVGGSRRFTDRDIRPWLLAEFQAVTDIVIHSPNAPVASVTEIGIGEVAAPGIVTAARADWTAADGARPSSPIAFPPAPLHVASPVELEDTVIRPPVVDADTVILRRDTVRDTVRDTEPGTSTAVEQDAEAPPGAHIAADRPAYTFRIGRGESLPIDGVYLIGRNPRTRRVPLPGGVERLVAVHSPTLEVSSTHLELRTEGDSVVVTDLRSTNGTVVVPPRAGRIRLRPGESLVVTPGTTIHIGDGTIITISATEALPHGTAPRTPTTRRPTT